MQEENLIEKLGSLRDELDTVGQNFMEMAPQELQEIIFDRLKAHAESEIKELALQEGDVAPDFVLPDSNGNLVSSVDLRAKGPLVVMFFRGNWCAYCDATLRMIRKYTPHFKARGATVVAISPQTVEASANFVKEAGLNFPVLSDTNSQYAQLCNIAYVLDDALKAVFEGVDLPKQNGDDSYILPIPATYVFETDGRVTYSFLETDFSKRAEPIDVLNALPRLKLHRRRSLTEKIEFELAKLRDLHPERKMKTLFDEIERLKASDVESSALRTGDKAPDFKLYDERVGNVIDSKKIRKHGPLIVTFYHGHASPLCMLQLEALQKYISKFEAKGATLVALSPPASSSNDLYQTVAYSGAKFPLLSDMDNEVAKQFGIAHETIDYLSSAADWEEKRTLPMTATYVIDRSGLILYSFVNVDHTQRAEPSKVLKAIPTKQPRDNLKRGPFSFVFGSRLAPRPAKTVRAY
jgi:peroxiredoxin